MSPVPAATLKDAAPAAGQAAERSAPFVRVVDVAKSFGALEVLKGISFEVARGQVLALLGPSGSGKSTMLRCLNFTEPYDAGEIWIDGQPVGYRFGAGGARASLHERDVAALRSDVGIVFQSYNLFPHLTVLRNLTLAPTLVRGLSRRQADEVAHALLDKVGLRDKAQEFPLRLSGGQQQRVAIARALAMRPKVMLFDEVTSALDPELVDEVLAVMRQLAGEGLTMVVVTHEIAFARDVADQVLFLDGGRVVERGPPDALLERPSTPRLQAFLRRYAGTARRGPA